MASFTCSKCRLPISLAPELEDPTSTSFRHLKGSSTTARPRTTQKAYPSTRESVLHEALSDSAATITSSPITQRRARIALPSKTNTTDSFVLLTDSEYKRGDTLSKNLEQQRKLFDLLSENSEIDHPLCGECTDTMISAMNKKIAALERDRKAYIAFLHKVKNDVSSQEDYDTAEAEVVDLQKQEQLALEELQSVEREHADVLAELAQLEKESAQLDQEEEEFWQERNRVASELEAFQNERESINLRFDHDATQLERLQKTNVYNDTFHIGHDGNFGTINGLRLGRLPKYPVSWDEINAAWGLTLLLLSTMAEKLEYKFSGYELLPMGSSSTIKKIDVVEGHAPKIAVLELFGSSDPNPLKLFQRHSFDKAMVAFLECLRQLGNFAESKDPTVVMPYKITKDKDKIADACIRTAFNQDEGWTQALKFCLTNCKWILAVVARLRN